MILFFVTLIIYSIMRCIPTSYVEDCARRTLPGGKSYSEWLTQLNAAYGFDKGIVEVISPTGWFPRSRRLWRQLVLQRSRGAEVQRRHLEQLHPGRAFLRAGDRHCRAAGHPGRTQQYSRTDYAVTIFALIGISLPTFYFATILKYILSVKLGWLDLFGQVGRYYEQLDSWGKALDVAKHYIMPVITLTIVSVGGLMRYTRTNMLEVLNAGLHPHRACQGRFGKARHQLSRFPQHADPAGDHHRRLDPRPVLRCADYRDAVPDRGHRLDFTRR